MTMPEGTRALMAMFILSKHMHGIHSHKISSQMNTYERFCSGMLDSIPNHHHQPTRGYISWDLSCQYYSGFLKTCKGYSKVH